MNSKKKLETYLRVNLLGPGVVLRKKNLRGCGLTKVEKHCPRGHPRMFESIQEENRKMH